MTFVRVCSIFDKAHSCQVRGELTESLRLHLIALEQRRQLLQENHNDLADSLHACAEIELLLCKLGDGLRHNEEASLIRRKVLFASNPNHYKVSESLFITAEVYRLRANYPLARDLYNKSAAIMKASLGMCGAVLGWTYVYISAMLRYIYFSI